MLLNTYAISNLISTLLTDSHRILTVSTFLNGEIGGVKNVSLGVPVVLSKNGIRNIVKIRMNEIECMEFYEAATTVKEATEIVFKSLR